MSVLKLEVPGWGARRQVEYGAEIRATRENGVIALEANDAGFLELALETLLLAGPGVPEGTWVEIDEYSGVLAEGSMPLILTRTESPAGEVPAPWLLTLKPEQPDAALAGLGIEVAQDELAIYGDGAALAELGRRFLLAAPYPAQDGIDTVSPQEIALTCATGNVVLRKTESAVDVGSYPAVWEVLFERLDGWSESSDFEVDAAGRRWLSARALQVLGGLLSGCEFLAEASEELVELASAPTVDCLSPSNGKADFRSSCIDCSALDPKVGLFSIAGESEGRLFATNRLVHRAMRSRLLGFKFRVLWDSGQVRFPQLLHPVGNRELAALSPAPYPIRACEEG